MNLQRDLIQKGYSFVPIKSKDYKLILKFQAAWKKFLELPLNQKNKVLYNKGAGYEHKGAGVTFDQKENFHFKISDVARLNLLANTMDPESKTVFQNYINAGKKTAIIYRNLMCTMKAELQSLVDISDCNLEYSYSVSDNDWVQRSLCYWANQDKAVSIADSHADKGFITLAPYSSQPGLQILCPQTRKWIDIVIPKNHVLVMMGLQGQFLTGGKVKAVNHRVMNSDGTIQYSRFSQVVFCDLKDQPKYNKRLHGSTQHRHDEYNYDCSELEFAASYM